MSIKSTSRQERSVEPFGSERYLGFGQHAKLAHFPSRTSTEGQLLVLIWSNEVEIKLNATARSLLVENSY